MNETPEIKRVLKPLRPSRPPQKLYHYTSGAGLIAIIASRSLWSTSIRFLNDSTEYDLSLTIAAKVLALRKKDVYLSFDKGLFSVLEKAVENAKTGEAYVSSFSEHADQLSQWRAYSPIGGGYSIGFSAKSLIKKANSYPNRYVAKCIYDAIAQERIIDELVEAVVITANTEREQRIPDDRVFREAFKLFSQLLIILSPVLKHHSFQEEEEWRLICLESSFEDSLPRFRVGPSTLIPFFEHPLAEPAEHLPISEVVIGPTPHPQLAKRATESLLTKSALVKAQATSSTIPFRAW